MHKEIIFWGLCAVLAFVPLPLGSVDEWAIFVFEAATVALFLIYLAGELLARRKAGASSRPLNAVLPHPVKILLALFLAWSVFQILPLPPSVVKFISPGAASIYQGLARDGLAGWNARSWWTLSLSPHVSTGELALLVCYGLFGFLVLRTVRSRRRVEILALVVVASALFQAFYGMAETFSGSEMIFGYQKKYNIGSVTGTYVNRNHFAGFLEMAFPLSLGYLLAKARFFSMERGLGWRRKLLWFSQESLQWTLLFGLGTVLIGLALIFSKSRSGIMIFLTTLVLAVGAIGTWREFSPGEEEGLSGRPAQIGRMERRRSRAAVRLVFLAVVGAALWLGLGPVVERFAETDFSREGRLVILKNSLEMVRRFPLAGTGKGTFLDSYAMYKKVDDGYQLSYAHDDYLELVTENGLVGGGCLIAAGVGLFVALAGAWRRRRANFAKGVGLGAILGLVAILLHSLTDFNLQIPANAVYFVGLCALAVNVVKKRGEGEEGEEGGRERGRVRRGGAISQSCASGLGRDPGNGEGPEPGGASGGTSANRATAESVRQAGHGHPGGMKGMKPWNALAGASKAAVWAALAVVAVAILVFAGREFQAFRYLGLYQDARAEARSVQSDFPRLEALLDKATAWSANPVILRERGRLELEMARAENETGNSEKRDTTCDRAVASYEAVLARNAIDSFAHYELGLTYTLYNFPLMTYADKGKLYFRKALELNPADEFLNLNILFFYLTSWDGLSAEDREYAGERLKKITAADRGFMPQLEQRWKERFGTADRLQKILILGSGRIN